MLVTHLPFTFFDPVTLIFDHFNGGRAIMMDYPCTKFDYFSFSHFGFIVWTDRQTDRQTHRQTESYTDAAHHLIHMTVVGMSKKLQHYCNKMYF